MLSLAACDSNGGGAGQRPAGGSGDRADGVEPVVPLERPSVAATQPAALLGDWWDAIGGVRLVFSADDPDAEITPEALFAKRYIEERRFIQFVLADAASSDPGRPVLVLDGMPYFRHTPEDYPRPEVWPGPDPADSIVGTFGELPPGAEAVEDRERFTFRARRRGLGAEVIRVTGGTTTTSQRGTYVLSGASSPDVGVLSLRWVSDVRVANVAPGRLDFATAQVHETIATSPPGTLTLGHRDGEYQCIAPRDDAGRPAPGIVDSEATDARGRNRGAVPVALIGTFQTLQAALRVRRTLTINRDGTFSSEIAQADSAGNVHTRLRGGGRWRLYRDDAGDGVSLALWVEHALQFAVLSNGALRLRPIVSPETQTLRFTREVVRIGPASYRPASDEAARALRLADVAPGDLASRSLVGAWQSAFASGGVMSSTLVFLASGEFEMHNAGRVDTGRWEQADDGALVRWRRDELYARDD